MYVQAIGLLIDGGLRWTNTHTVIFASWNIKFGVGNFDLI
jgi:hypothetical protein